MVSKAKEDFPEPLKPVKTINLFLGISKLIFLRLFSLAPLIIILSFDILFPPQFVITSSLAQLSCLLILLLFQNLVLLLLVTWPVLSLLSWILSHLY